ncbi:MAG TPA: hypothetical protein VGK02_02660 [Candidatus Aquicultor sp.]|jgi:predicted transcriptional regulator
MPISKDIQELLDNVIDTLVKWDMIAYLQLNPNDLVSPEDIASSVGRSVSEVKQALSELSACKIVQYQDDGATICYRFSPCKTWQPHIEKFTKMLNDRSMRWLILNYLIEKDGKSQNAS